MNWRKVWYRGVLPLADREGLESLLKACREDNPSLIQGETTRPPPLRCVEDWPVEGCDALSWLAWRGGEGELTTVAEVEEFFARAFFEIDQRMGEPAGCRHFLNWFDEAPRGEVMRDLGSAIELSLMVLDAQEHHPVLWQMLTAVITVQDGTTSGIDLNALGQATDYCQDVGLSEWSECLLWAFTSRKRPIRGFGGLMWEIYEEETTCYQEETTLDMAAWDLLARHDYPDSGWAYLDLVRALEARRKVVR